MPLILLVPLLFAVLGGGVSWFIARLQGLRGRAFWGAIAGGVVGGAIGGVLTVPLIGIGATVTVVAATTLPEASAATTGVVAEYVALSAAQGVGSGAGQAAGNLVTGDPLGKGVVLATAIGGASQLGLAPLGDRVVLGLVPLAPVAGRTVSAVLTRLSAPGPVVAALGAHGVPGALATRWAGESTTEALTDGVTMVVPVPGGEKDSKRGAKPVAPPPPEAAGFSTALTRAVRD